MPSVRSKPTSKRRISPVAKPVPIRSHVNARKTDMPLRDASPPDANEVKEAEELKDRGVQLYQSGSYADAFIVFSLCIKKDSTNPKYFLNRALVSLELRLYDQAREDSKDAVKRIEARRSVALSILSHSPSSAMSSSSSTRSISRSISPTDTKRSLSRSVSPADSGFAGLSPTATTSSRLVALYERAEVSRLKSKAAYVRGMALHRLGRWHDALASFDNALALKREEGAKAGEGEEEEILAAARVVEHLMATKSDEDRLEWAAQQGALDVEPRDVRPALFAKNGVQRKMQEEELNWAARFNEF